MRALFQPHDINTLVIGEWWRASDLIIALRPFLGTMPTLTTLYFEKQYIDHESLGMLTRGASFASSQINFPEFCRIYICWSIIEDIGNQARIKEMVSSHPLEELVIGGTLRENPEIVEAGSVSDVNAVEAGLDIAGSDLRVIPIRNWLQKTLPEFTLLEREQCVRFKSSEW
ncbi:hypothetical protein FRC11_007923 [Ceratobasidium sp. 423]|nr:hypothetical protein FRC11_007923 [Ceratobasidium sp. 423]